MDSLLSSSRLDPSTLSDRDKQELQQFIMAESQKATIQQSIHALTDTCFRKCVTSKISSGKLDARAEEPCVQNCVERFLDANHLILRQLESMRNSA